MHSKIRQAFILLFVLVIAIFFVIGAVMIMWWLLALNPQISGPIAAGILGFASLIYAQWHSKGREIQESHRPKKIDVYNEFFDVLGRFVKNPDDLEELEEGELPQEVKDQFWSLNRGLIVWSSPKVLRSWLRFRQLSGSESGISNALLLDELLQAIREDLGNSNYGLARGDVVQLFLKDPQEQDKSDINK